MRNMNQFDAATLKLTAWYLAILMAVSLAFSVIIYQIIAREFDRPLPPESQQSRFFTQADIIREARVARAVESKRNVLINLTIMNVVTLTFGAGASYLFARRTLRPIEHAMDAQAQFVSDASHELRTPLAVMRTENEIVLRGRKVSVDALKDVVTSNLEEIERLQLLTDRLLALSSEQELPLTAFSIGEAVHEAVLRHEIAAKQKKIKLNVEAVDVSTSGHMETVCDIVSILIDNAIKYSPARSTVTVTAAEQGNRIVVSVADEGDGIASEDVSRIFDRFYRADQSRSKQHVEGHGLGLALAKRLSDLNRAQLRVANREPHGAVFTLELEKA